MSLPNIKSNRRLTSNAGAGPATGEVQVSTLELFFDLVFVFTITQVGEIIGHTENVLAYAQAALALSVTWWMYAGYAWLTNNIGTRRMGIRLLLLAAMMGFLVMALAMPRVFSGDGIAFGIAYLAVNLVHLILFTRAPNNSARAIWAIAPFNIGTAIMVVVAGYLGGSWAWGLWLGVFALHMATPFLGTDRGFELNPAHFVERHGLVLLIVLGETVVSIGVGASKYPIGGPLLLAVVLSLGLSAVLWWTYFDGDDERAVKALSRLSGGKRSRAALLAYGYSQLVMMAGIVLAAEGIKEIVGDVLGRLRAGVAAALASGIGLYMAGTVAFRASLGLGPRGLRIAAIAAIGGCAAAGIYVNGAAELTALTLVLTATIALERVRKGRQKKADAEG